jgi:cysteine synthase A
MSNPTRPATLGLAGTIGATPLIQLNSLANICPGARVLAKAEQLSPGGSVKDRVALAMILDAEAKGLLGGHSGVNHIVESTGGNTGIGLALVCLARGYKVTIVMNNTIAVEKQNLMKTFGAELLLVDPKPFSSELHYYHIGKKIAEDHGWFYCNQFENLANSKAHYETTGPEIWAQSGGLDAFVCAAGTGGTISGISRRLKEFSKDVKVFLIDLPSGVLHSYLTTHHLTPLEGNAAGLEGIGIDRITDNFRLSKIDGVMKSQAQQAVRMAWWLLKHEGVFVGGSAAFNALAAAKVARYLAKKQGRKGKEVSVATILCDSGDRSISKIYSKDWLAREFGADFDPVVDEKEMIRMIDEEVDLMALPKTWTEEHLVVKTKLGKL